jgi:hypothetical protein
MSIDFNAFTPWMSLAGGAIGAGHAKAAAFAVATPMGMPAVERIGRSRARRAMASDATGPTC